jgi:hypothetical protein
MHSRSTAPWEHEHVFLGASHGRHERRTMIVVAVTAAMMVMEIIGGTAFGSMALVADGWHMSTHAAALGIAALAYRFARPAPCRAAWLLFTRLPLFNLLSTWLKLLSRYRACGANSGGALSVHRRAMIRILPAGHCAIARARSAAHGFGPAGEARGQCPLRRGGIRHHLRSRANALVGLSLRLWAPFCSSSVLQRAGLPSNWPRSLSLSAIAPLQTEWEPPAAVSH